MVTTPGTVRQARSLLLSFVFIGGCLLSRHVWLKHLFGMAIDAGTHGNVWQLFLMSLNLVVAMSMALQRPSRTF